MYVCICEGITDKQIIRAIQEGAQSLKCLQKELNIAMQCGKCAEYAIDLILQHQSLSEKLSSSLSTQVALAETE